MLCSDTTRVFSPRERNAREICGVKNTPKPKGLIRALGREVAAVAGGRVYCELVVNTLCGVNLALSPRSLTSPCSRPSPRRAEKGEIQHERPRPGSCLQSQGVAQKEGMNEN